MISAFFGSAGAANSGTFTPSNLYKTDAALEVVLDTIGEELDAPPTWLSLLEVAVEAEGKFTPGMLAFDPLL